MFIGLRNIMLKLSSRGGVVLVDPVHVRPAPVTAAETTTAGDAFNGAFAVALSEGCSAVDAAEFAATTSRIAQSSMPTQGEIDTVTQDNHPSILMLRNPFGQIFI